MLLNETISVTLSGTSTTGLSVSLAPAYTLKNATVADYLHDTYTINPATVNAVLAMGLITTAHHILAITDGPLTLTLTQSAVDRNIDLMSGTLLLDGDFTAIKISNSGTAARQLTLLITGDRNPVGVGPGIYSV